MKRVENTCVVLAARPEGMPTEDCWRLETRVVPGPADGQVLVDIETISIDPACGPG